MSKWLWFAARMAWDSGGNETDDVPGVDELNRETR
jgi:hypothetical protein